MDIYSKIKPVSPFATVDTIEIMKKHETKRYNKIYGWIIIMVIIILCARYYFNRYYFFI